MRSCETWSRNAGLRRDGKRKLKGKEKEIPKKTPVKRLQELCRLRQLGDVCSTLQERVVPASSHHGTGSLLTPSGPLPILGLLEG